MDFINQMEPVFDDAERLALNDYMLSGGWGTEFQKTRMMEKMIKEYTGAKHCWMMPNGTVSLSCALVAVGICAGDEVLVPDYTMAATANSVHLLGAKAVFVDIKRRDLCLDVNKTIASVSDKTKAIIYVSINGRCSDDFDTLVDFCK